MTSDTSTDDPFTDRQEGPRTRSRVRTSQEVQETPRAARSSTAGSVPPPESPLVFAPACFPSLDPGATLAENNRIRREQELKKAAEQEINQFSSNEYSKGRFYFGEDLKIKVEDIFDLKAASEPVAPQVSDSKVESHIAIKKEEKPVRYKSFVTRNSSGELTKWHRRATSSQGSPSPIPENLGLSGPNNSESDSEDDQKPYTPRTLSSGSDHPLLGEFLKRRLGNNMAENAAPAVNSDDATRGMPYYERLKKTLKTSIKQKQDLEETLAKIEQSIWNKEGAYLDETIAGNIMKGFDNYIKASGAQGGSTSGGGTSSRKKATVSEQDRLFSRSSVGFWNSMREGSPHASSTSTPSHAPTPKGLSDHPTPTSTTSTKAPGLKKKRADDELDGKPPNKRLKITFSRNDKD